MAVRFRPFYTLWYAGLGIGAAGPTLAAVVCAVLLGVPDEQRLPLLIAGLLAIAHSLTTARAALINLRQPSTGFDRWA